MARIDIPCRESILMSIQTSWVINGTPLHPEAGLAVEVRVSDLRRSLPHPHTQVVYFSITEVVQFYFFIGNHRALESSVSRVLSLTRLRTS
jgi:hypothetical protein